MSNSYKKTPIAGYCQARSAKWFKSMENRRMRSAAKMLLKTHLDETILPHPKKYGNPWSDPRDGKWYIDFKRCKTPRDVYTMMGK